MNRRRLPALALLFGAPFLLGMAPPDPAKVFEKAARSGATTAMLGSAEKLREDPSEEGAEVLLKYAWRIEDVDVYIAGRNALAACKDGEAREVVDKAATRGKPAQMRVLACDAIALMDDDRGVNVLGRALDSRDYPVRVAAIRGLAKLRRRTCVPPLMDRLSKLDLNSNDAEVVEVERALFSLTGKNFETLEDWQKFISTLPSDFDPKTRAADEKGPVTTRERGPKLFDSEVISNKFVLCLDVSTSMRVIDLPMGEEVKTKEGKIKRFDDPGFEWPPEPESRFARARDELIRFVENLDKKTEFTILCFAEKKDVKVWQKKTVRANGKAKSAAIKWIRALKWSGATRTDLALKRAFEVPAADTIVIFSDGLPEDYKDGEMELIDQAEVLKLARTLNRTRKATITTYGFQGCTRKTKEFLRQMAAENDGQALIIR